MITKTVPLKYLTSIHQKGVVTVNYIEDINELNTDNITIGGGSNILFKNTHTVNKLSNRFNYIKKEGPIVRVGGATPIKSIIKFMLNNSLSCLEFLAGIPATIGGAVFMNAGAFGYEIADFIEYVTIKNSGSETLLEKSQLNFNYRTSNVNGVILEVGLRCKESKRTEIAKKIAEYITERKRKAHIKDTFGSVFKNPRSDLPAGKLIDECGLKGRVKGTAMISPKHGNFIVGNGSVDVDDVLFLIDLAKNEVLKRFSIELEEEVKII